MAWEPDYVTLAVARAYVGITDDADTTDDVRLATDITTASRIVDDHCHRQFGKVASGEARTFEGIFYVPARRAWCVDVDDLAAAAGLVVVADGVTLTTDDYRLTPLNSIQKGRPFERIELASRAWSVTLTTDQWGWANVPVPVQTATKLQLKRLFSRIDAEFGISGSPEQQGELRLLQRIDVDAAMAVHRYIREERPR